MKDIYNLISKSAKVKRKMFAVLIDPDKIKLNTIPNFIGKLNNSLVTHIFVGGSIVSDGETSPLVSSIKQHTNLPIVLFPGDINQITDDADALLFLSLISGRNSDYLIEKHVNAVALLRKSSLEIIPTGYVLIANGKETAVELVTNTKPMSKNNVQFIVDTVKAGELLGMKLMYLEAGSGAEEPIPSTIIRAVKKELKIPLIVGGGIRSKQQLNEIYEAGADLVVIGTAFENNIEFFNELV